MKTFSTNMQHYLNEAGHFPKDLPKEAKQLAEFFGSIVVAVTSGDYPDFPMIGIKCIHRAEKNKKACNGMIEAGFICSSNPMVEIDIGWHCDKCGSSGVITGWEDTMWDIFDDGDERVVH